MNLEWPRIVYHLTDGNVRSDYGYTYQRCNTQEEFDELAKKGFKLTPDEVFGSVAPKLNETQSTAGASVGNQFFPGSDENKTQAKKPVKKAVKKTARKAARKAA